MVRETSAASIAGMTRGRVVGSTVNYDGARLLCLCAASAVLVVSAIRLEAQTAPSGPQLLDKLRAIDALYESGFACSGSLKRPPSRLSVGRTGGESMKWKFTSSNGRCAVLEESTELPELTFIEPGKVQDVSYDPDGKMLADVTTTRRVVLGAEFAGTREDYAAFALTADSKSRMNYDVHGVFLAPPDTIYDLWARTPLYCAGRGFTRHIDEVTSVEETKEGLFLADAKGSFVGDSGKWRLIIDPKAGYMVRSAEFTRNNADGVSTRISNTGLIWNGAYCIPERGFSQGRAKEGEFTFESADGKFDEDLFETSENSMKPPFPPGTNVIDQRSKPPLMYHIEGIKVPKVSREELRKKALSMLEAPEGEAIQSSASEVPEPSNDAAQALKPPSPAPLSGASESRRYLLPRAYAWLGLAAIAIAVGVVLVVKRRRK